MSNIISFQASNLPATLQARLAQFNAGNVLSNLGGSEELDKISIKAGRFRVKQAGMEEVVLQQLFMDCVIVFANAHVSKAYYTKTYDPSAEDQSPSCASSNGYGPDAGVKEPQSSNCATCAQNVWGSRISPRGSKIKACGDSQRIAVLPIDPSSNNFFMVDGKPKAFGMSVPAASMKALGQFAKTLAQQGVPLEIALARLTFDSSAEFPKLQFAFNSVLPEQAAIYILDFVEQNNDHLKKLVGADIAVAQNVQVAQPQQQAPVQAQMAQAPQVQQPMQAAAPAPQVAPVPSFGVAPQPAAVAPTPVVQAAPAVAAPVMAAPAPSIAAAPNGLLNALQGVMG